MPEFIQTFLNLVSGLPDQCGMEPGCWFISFWLLGFMLVFYAVATVCVFGVPIAILSAPFQALYVWKYGEAEHYPEEEE